MDRTLDFLSLTGSKESKSLKTKSNFIVEATAIVL
jgi:hypothetical protein